jgi:hypothetical protein
MELINCAIIEDNTVVNVIVVESLEKAIEIFGGEIITITDSGPHMGWTRSGDTWTEPVSEEPIEESIND